MKICVKASPEYFYKEKTGLKPNTIRLLPVSDADHSTRDTIEVTNTQTGEKFEREITDISFWNGMMIISWRHEDSPGSSESDGK